ncbi:hypothetical protein M885DRAFT_571055 [Pelagophyceae sp. CCMP2097]|nr:hypothetical protein M885DRAFT_571055 [Pelagophyceae sp. CCMP2097]
MLKARDGALKARDGARLLLRGLRRDSKMPKWQKAAGEMAPRCDQNARGTRVAARPDDGDSDGDCSPDEGEGGSPGPASLKGRAREGSRTAAAARGRALAAAAAEYDVIDVIVHEEGDEVVSLVYDDDRCAELPWVARRRRAKAEKRAKAPPKRPSAESSFLSAVFSAFSPRAAAYIGELSPAGVFAYLNELEDAFEVDDEDSPARPTSPAASAPPRWPAWKPRRMWAKRQTPEEAFLCEVFPPARRSFIPDSFMIPDIWPKKRPTT